MSNNPSILNQSCHYMGKDLIIIKNEASLPITHIGTLFPTLNIQLLDVLVVPLLTKKYHFN